MRPINSRLRKIDVYSAAEMPDGYIGTKIEPTLIGFIYADVQPQADKLEENREGVSVSQNARLFLRPDAGISCGDLVALYGSKPDCRITEVKRAREYAAATAVRI